MLTKILDEIRKTADEIYRPRIESSSFVKELALKNLSLESYSGFVRTMAVIHGNLEKKISESLNPFLSSVWSDEMKKTLSLKKDSAYLKWVKNVPEIMNITKKIVKNIQEKEEKSPETLAGYLYALQISGLESGEYRKSLILQYPCLKDKADHYLQNNMSGVQKNLDEFRVRLERVQADSVQASRILDGACELFDWTVETFENLFPLQTGRKKYFALDINSDAGSHPVPEDAREILAAISAGDLCADLFLYQDIRFGSRGRKFAHSDSAWLASLSDLEQSEVTSQTVWLANVLSNRGIPSCMLENHLDILYNELCIIIPENEKKYRKLKNAADGLRAFRRIYLNDQVYFSLSERFNDRLKYSFFRKTGLSAELCASALIDSKGDAVNAVQNIYEWMNETQVADPEEFLSFLDEIESLIQSSSERISSLRISI